MHYANTYRRNKTARHTRQHLRNPVINQRAVARQKKPKLRRYVPCTMRSLARRRRQKRQQCAIIYSLRPARRKITFLARARARQETYRFQARAMSTREILSSVARISYISNFSKRSFASPAPRGESRDVAACTHAILYPAISVTQGILNHVDRGFSMARCIVIFEFPARWSWSAVCCPRIRVWNEVWNGGAGIVKIWLCTKRGSKEKGRDGIDINWCFGLWGFPKDESGSHHGASWKVWDRHLFWDAESIEIPSLIRPRWLRPAYNSFNPVLYLESYNKY